MSAVAALAALILAGVVVAEGVRASADLRRRVRVDRAMHELRRPIQSLALAIDGDSSDFLAARSWLDQVRDALAELDAAIDGSSRSCVLAPVPLDDLASGLERRWGRAGVRVDSPPAGPTVEADARRLGAALDNLVSNALRHGSGPVSVRALTAPGVARFEVRDGGPPGGRDERSAVGDPRHGHGLAIASSVARSHGGTLSRPRHTVAAGTVAALTLPAADPSQSG